MSCLKLTHLLQACPRADLEFLNAPACTPGSFECRALGLAAGCCMYTSSPGTVTIVAQVASLRTREAPNQAIRPKRLQGKSQLS